MVCCRRFEIYSSYVAILDIQITIKSFDEFCQLILARNRYCYFQRLLLVVLFGGRDSLLGAIPEILYLNCCRFNNTATLYRFEESTCDFRRLQESVSSGVQTKPAVSVIQDESNNPESFHVRLFTRDFNPLF